MAPSRRLLMAGVQAALVAALLVPGTSAFAQEGWSAPPAALSGSYIELLEPLVAFNAAGDGVAVWTHVSNEYFVPHVSRYSRASGTWSTPLDLAPPTAMTLASDVSIDDTGAITIALYRMESMTRFLEVVRYTPASGVWSAPVDIGGGGHLASAAMMSANAAGEVVAVWARFVLGTTDVTASIHATRYNPGSGSWSPVADLSPAGGLAYFPQVAMAPDGTAIAVWKRSVATSEYVQAARFAAGGWGPGADISPLQPESEMPAEIAMDAAGNAVVVWIGGTAVVSARFTASSTTWGPVTTVAAGAGESWPSVAVDPAGNAVAVWTENEMVHAARLPASAGSWGAAVVLSPITMGNWWARQPVVMDQAGNAFVAWRWSTLSNSVIQVARYTAATGTWGGAIPPVSDVGSMYGDSGTALAVDGNGSAAAVWIQAVGGWHIIQTRRWEATPGAPTITGVTPASGTLSVAFAAPPTAEAAFAPLNYEYSLDDGASWTARAPAATASPLAVTGLATNVAYSLRLRAVNPAGAGAASAAEVVVADAVPSPPTELEVASVVGNVVTLTWHPPVAGGPSPTGYVLEGGVVPGQVLASIPTGSTAPAFTITAPTGAFYIRMYTLAVVGGVTRRSLASNEIRIFVNVPEPPSAPAHLLGVASGSTLALSWTNTYGGGAPSDVWLRVTGAVAAVVPLGLIERWSFPAVPPGSYTMQVIASNAAGPSGPSNAVTLAFPASCGITNGAPGIPERLAASRAGRAITVMWSPPETGGAVSGYFLHVSGSYVGTFGTTSRVLSGAVGPGSYTFEVVAWNTCGTSRSTTPVTVVVP